MPTVERVAAAIGSFSSVGLSSADVVILTALVGLCGFPGLVPSSGSGLVEGAPVAR